MSSFQLSVRDIGEYQTLGHVTVCDVFRAEEIEAARADIVEWSREFLSTLPEEERGWYLERGTGAVALRKLDHPVFEREVFRRLARQARLVACVEQLIGQGLRVWFSQVFMKPPGGGGPKPVHQDNFYFGPSDPDGIVTVWIALDDATTENGCLYYADGSHTGPVLKHVAPENEPFNLQVSPELAAQYDMTPAPVPSGGVSFHHGNTLHQSSENRSDHPRRAVAMHYVNACTTFRNSALKFDESLVVNIDSES